MTAARGLSRTFIPLDEPISWGCSGQGWNCCVDKDIPLRPYDVHRLAEATGKTGQQLLNEGTISLEWDGYGLLGGWMATQPYEDTRQACVFYEELTTADALRIRDTDTERFRALPSNVRDAADESGEDRPIAGLCNAHTGRPEACRGFPFQRHPLWEEQPERAAAQISDCGSCALPDLTTPREVMLDNGLEPYWRADEAYRAVVQYLHKCGLANLGGSAYRRLPLPPEERLALWSTLYTHPGGYLDALETTLDRADALIAESGIPRSQLGGAGDALTRPNVATLLDPSRAVLPD